MFTSIIKESLGTKVAECNEIIYNQTLIHDEYESRNIASQKEIGNVSILNTLGSHTHLSAAK